MEKIILIVHANLRHFVEGKSRLEIPWVADKTLEAILREAGIPRHAVAFCTIMGRQFSETCIPEARSEIEILPALSGG